MNDFTLRVSLELGTRRREFEAAELAAALDQDDLEPVLLALLFDGPCPQVVNKRRGTLGGGDPRKERNANDDMYALVREGEEKEKGCRGKEREEKAEALAFHLADRLNDHKSLALYRRMAHVVPAGIIRDCLARALDVPRSEVRRSRAAYFTALCLPHLREREGRADRPRQS